VSDRIVRSLGADWAPYEIHVRYAFKKEKAEPEGFFDERNPGFIGH